MYQVLVLTENILANRSLQEKLQGLNDEVWCSSQLLSQIPQSDFANFICQQFQVVVFSNTICDKNVQKFLDIFGKRSMALLRETDIELDEEQKSYWREQGLHEWINLDALPSVIREKMVLSYKKVLEMDERLKKTEVFPFDYSEEKLEANQIRLSGREKRVLKILAQAQGSVINRKELCERLWSNGQNASNMSQLSCIIRRIERKFKEGGINNLVITTHWGKGYQLEAKQRVQQASSWL